MAASMLFSLQVYLKSNNISKKGKLPGVIGTGGPPDQGPLLAVGSIGKQFIYYIDGPV